MKKLLLFILFFGTAKFFNAQSFDWAFSLNTGFGCDMTLDSSGNIIILGNMHDTLGDIDPSPDTFNITGNGYNHIFVAKYSSSGSFINAVSLNGSYYHTGWSIKVIQNNNVIISGSYMDSIDFDPGPGLQIFYAPYGAGFVLKLDSNFNFVWVKSLNQNISSYGGAASYVSIDQEGNIYGTGNFKGSIDFDPGAPVYNLTANITDQFILKLDSSGNFIWAKVIHSDKAVSPKAITLDNEKNVYISGGFLGTTDFDGDTGVYNLSVHPNTIQWSNQDIFISKYDSLGNLLWAKRVGGKESDWNSDMQIIANRYLILCGGFNDTVDFDPNLNTYYLQVDSLSSGSEYDSYTLKLDTAGNFIWAKQFKKKTSVITPLTYNQGISIITNTLGNIIISGIFRGDSTDFDPGPGNYYLTPAGTSSFFVFLDSSGNFISANKIGSTNEFVNVGRSINGPYGNYLFAGGFYGSIDFDFGPNNYILVSDSVNTSFFLLSIIDINTGLMDNIFSQNNISIFPNPTTDFITIQYNLTTAKEITISLFNVYGQKVKGELVAGGVKEIKIDMQNFPAGIYFVKVSADGKEEVRKVVKY